jgi:hypothetical protein
MVFSDTTNNSGLVQDSEFTLGVTISSTGDYNIKDYARNANRALDRAVQIIITADGTWQFDDNNQTDMPWATADLVASQNDYTIASTHLEITRVEAKDSDGNWTKLQPFDQTELYSSSLTDFNSTDGKPMYYDKIGESIMVYPAPAAGVTGGLKVWFTRPPSYFSADGTDTTTEPGFASIFHRYISICASYDFASIKGFQIAATLREQKALMEEEMRNFYSRRAKDEKITIKARPVNYE